MSEDMQEIGRVPSEPGSHAPHEPAWRLRPSGFDPSRVIQCIAEAAEAIAAQAGVGGMETAGSIVSYLAKHPEQIDPFLTGEVSVLDWPADWHRHGRLTWHGMNGKIVTPAQGRRADIIKRMERAQ